MNPDKPSREQIEARITALLLGELPAAEAELLRWTISRDLELQKLHDHLKLTIGFVREAMKNPTGAPVEPEAPLKLSQARRQTLLAHFKTARPQKTELSWLKRLEIPSTSSLVIGAVIVLVICGLAAISIPNLVKARATSQVNACINNLRQIDAAKQEWALEKHMPANAEPTANDLTPYLQGQALRPVAGENYDLGKVSEPTVAELNGKRLTANAEYFASADSSSANEDQGIINNTRQISGAANEWDLKAGKTRDGVPGIAGAEPSVDRIPQEPKVTPPPVQIALPNTEVSQTKSEQYDTNVYSQNVVGYINVNPSVENSAQISSGGSPSNLPEPAPNTETTFALTSQSQPQAQTASPFASRLQGASPKTGVQSFGEGGGVAAPPFPSSALTVELAPPQPVSAPSQVETETASSAPVVESPRADHESSRNEWAWSSNDKNLRGLHLGIVGGAGQVASSAQPISAGGTYTFGTAGNLPQSSSESQPNTGNLPWQSQSTLSRRVGSAGAVGGEIAPAAPVNMESWSSLSDRERVADLKRAFEKPVSATNYLATKNDRGTFYRNITGQGVQNNDQSALINRENLDTNPITQNEYGLNTVNPVAGNSAVAPVDLPPRAQRQYRIGGVGSMPTVGALFTVRAPVPPSSPQQYAQNKQALDEDRNLREASKSVKEADIPLTTPPATAPIPQPEIQTSDNAFSTFSLNVSDVSFKLAMASLEKGQMPAPASIRSEEFINAFDYHDPEPLQGEPLAFTSERSRDPFAQERDFLRFSIKAAAAGRQGGRALNLVLLLDTSGSMERADRVAIIREALRVLSAQLQPQDIVSVVTFARTARLWADGIPGNEAGATLDKVGSITPEGGTNLEEAMRLAYETALRHFIAGGMNRVVMLTDGAANLGNVDPQALTQKVETERRQGIALDCFGIGWDDYNDDLLEQLSSSGDGRYAFINSPDEAATEFASKLAGALQVAAEDVKVQVEFNPNRVTAWRQIGYAKHQLTKEQFRDNSVAAGAIAAREAGNALYVIETNPNGEGPIATVRVRYRVPGTQDNYERSWLVDYDGGAPGLAQSSPSMRLAVSAAEISEWMADSPFAQEVTPDELLNYLSGVPEYYGTDERPKQLETMIREVKSVSGK